MGMNCKTVFYRDNCQEKRFRVRILQPIYSPVRLAVMSLDETLDSKPQMFSHSKTSQESQVVMRHILIDGVLSPHHFGFKPQNNEKKHLGMVVKNLS